MSALIAVSSAPAAGPPTLDAAIAISIVPSGVKAPLSAAPCVWKMPLASSAPYSNFTPVGSNVFMSTKYVVAPDVQTIRHELLRGRESGSRSPTFSVHSMNEPGLPSSVGLRPATASDSMSYAGPLGA